MSITGAEAALVVNNNAAAIMLILGGLAAGREVVISRGELVEIGGGFRVPDVMRQSGATLREVGTTNRTRITDYMASVSARDGDVPARASVELPHRGLHRAAGARGSGRRLARDEGADGRGPRQRLPRRRISPANHRCRRRSRAGVDLVCFSGDKLLGGPQCGIIAGRMAMIERLRTHPLMRALRADKITFAMLEATLSEYSAGRAATTIPVQRMLHRRRGDRGAGAGTRRNTRRKRLARRAASAARPRSAAAARPAWNCRRCCCRS